VVFPCQMVASWFNWFLHTGLYMLVAMLGIISGCRRLFLVCWKVLSSLEDGGSKSLVVGVTRIQLSILVDSIGVEEKQTKVEVYCSGLQILGSRGALGSVS
jgi:hypothetical protein